MFNSLWPHGLYGVWNSPGQNTGLGSLSLLPGIFPTQGSNPGLPHCGRMLYQLNHKGSPRILKWIASPFSSGSSRPRNRTGVSCNAGGFFTNWAVREAKCMNWGEGGGHKYSVHNKVLLVTQDPEWDSPHLNSGVMFVGFLQTVAVFLRCPLFWMRCPALRVIRDCVESPSGGFVWGFPRDWSARWVSGRWSPEMPVTSVMLCPGHVLSTWRIATGIGLVSWPRWCCQPSPGRLLPSTPTFFHTVIWKKAAEQPALAGQTRRGAEWRNELDWFPFRKTLLVCGALEEDQEEPSVLATKQKACPGAPERWSSRDSMMSWIHEERSWWGTPVWCAWPKQPGTQWGLKGEVALEHAEGRTESLLWPC